jgi:hypothetical protein
MRLPAGLDATGETVALDKLLDYGASASADPDPTRHR